jgi:integrase
MPSNAASPSPPVLGQPTEAGAVSASKPDTHLVTTLAPLVRALARLVSLTDQSIRKRIEMRTEQAFGRTINPHLFRDCVATSIAIEDPAHVQIAAAILGHNTLATTEKYYNQATSLEASRALQKTVLELRGNHPDPTL